MWLALCKGDTVFGSEGGEIGIKPPGTLKKKNKQKTPKFPSHHNSTVSELISSLWGHHSRFIRIQELTHFPDKTILGILTNNNLSNTKNVK